ncbi:MAG: methylated-DNA--[protein]-cysteine S-methyltransferase [Luteimonas sp.]
MSVYTTTLDSPVGALLLAADDDGLRLIEFPSPRHRYTRGRDWRTGDHPTLRAAAHQLAAYFTGDLRTFDLPLAPSGTAFQQTVWRALRDIAYGTTTSYGEIARRIDKPAAVRAVGAANGRNPLPIVVPCHRVIGTDGALTGFGGGLPTKQFLLTLEGALPREDLFAS